MNQDLFNDPNFDDADRAWEQFEFNGRYSNRINIDNYDAVRNAFIEGYIQAVKENTDENV